MLLIAASASLIALTAIALRPTAVKAEAPARRRG